MNNYQEDIAKTWDNINECLIDKTKAISHEDFMRAKAGELEISLAGIKTVPKDLAPRSHGDFRLRIYFQKILYDPVGNPLI